MQRFAIRQAFLGGAHAGIRSSLFASSVADPFVSLSGAVLGQSGQQWYSRAKQAVAAYDSWIVEARKVANKTWRDYLIEKYHGDPADRDGALYRRNSVASDIQQAESYTPVNYIVFDEPRRQSRVEQLEEWVSDLRRETKDIQETYGRLPEPVVIERLVPGEAPKWVLPVGIGLGAIAVAALLGAFGK